MLRHAARRGAAACGRLRAGALHTSPLGCQEEALPPGLDLDKPQQRKLGSPKVDALVDAVLELNMLEVSDFTTLLAQRLGLPAGGGMSFGAAPAAAAAPAASAGPAAAAAPAAAAPPEKSEFDVKLESFDAASKIKLIKEVRAATGLGLKEAKDLVRRERGRRSGHAAARPHGNATRAARARRRCAAAPMGSRETVANPLVVAQVEGAPIVVKKGLKKEDAEALLKKLTENGGKGLLV